MRFGDIIMVASTQGGGGAFYPSDLGASLLGLWDAEVSASLTLSGSSVITWADQVVACAPTQGTAANRPTLSATALNGRPAVLFDGTNDSLVLGSTPFPTGANPCEIWALTDQQALVADTGGRIIFTYGGGANTNNRLLRRMVTTGVNRAGILTGTGAAPTASNATIDYSGIHVARYIVSGTTQQVDVDGVAGLAGAAVPTTGTTALAIGAATGGGSQFWQGSMNMIAVTALLNAGQAAQMLAFMRGRGGI